eukprot:COSAG01_NODE_27894_length_674_cov_1.034783_1_plen_111_part_10
MIVTAPTVPYRIVPPGFTAEGRPIEGEHGDLDAEQGAASQVVEEETVDGGLPFFGSGVSEVSNAAEFDDNGPQEKAGGSGRPPAPPPPPAPLPHGCRAFRGDTTTTRRRGG